MNRRASTIIAHRGGGGDAPENTLAALERTLQDSLAAWCEVDVQRSRDGTLVVVHDATLERTSDVLRRFPDRAASPVAGFDFQELRALDCGAWFDAGRFAGERMPTLDEVLDLARGRIGLLLELKETGNSPGIEGDLVRALRAHGPQDAQPVEVWSFELDALRRVHALDPAIPLGGFGRSMAALDLPSNGRLLAAASLYPDMSPADAAQVAGAGLEIVAATQNSFPRIRQALATGARRVITDYPHVVDRVLRGEAGCAAEPSLTLVAIEQGPGPEVRRAVVRNSSAVPQALAGWYLRNPNVTWLPSSTHLGPSQDVRVPFHFGPRDAFRRGNRTVALHRPDHRVEAVIEY